ncbi:MAG: hypothetical protein ISS80_07910 [Candidatus Cloacimonetes bacterium]|nr:hypothetical protein [Candidatus Cloacimonadota bacterium]
MGYLGDEKLKKKKVKHKHGVNANQKVGVIANFYNNYSRLGELFGGSWHAYVNQHSASLHVG